MIYFFIYLYCAIKIKFYSIKNVNGLIYNMS